MCVSIFAGFLLFWESLFSRFPKTLLFCGNFLLFCCFLILSPFFDWLTSFFGIKLLASAMINLHPTTRYLDANYMSAVFCFGVLCQISGLSATVFMMMTFIALLVKKLVEYCYEDAISVFAFKHQYFQVCSIACTLALGSAAAMQQQGFWLCSVWLCSVLGQAAVGFLSLRISMLKLLIVNFGLFSICTVWALFDARLVLVVPLLAIPLSAIIVTLSGDTDTGLSKWELIVINALSTYSLWGCLELRKYNKRGRILILSLAFFGSSIAFLLRRRLGVKLSQGSLHKDMMHNYTNPTTNNNRHKPPQLCWIIYVVWRAWVALVDFRIPGSRGSLLTSNSPAATLERGS